jgi:hypothetical protein
MMPEENQTKSFWSRPEGTTGMLTLGGAAVALYFALPTLLIFMGGLVTLLGQTIAVIVLGAIAAGLLFVLTNKKFLNLVSYLFKSAMRKVTQVFVEIDPIGIMKTYIERMVEKREIMGSTRDKLRGQLRVLDEKIAKNEKTYDSSMKMARIAKEKGNAGVLTVNSRQAMRMQQLNTESLIPLKAQMEAHLRAANKYYEVTGTVIEDLKNEVDAQQTRREMILASHTVMKAAKAIMMGGHDEREMFDMAMEFVVQDYGMKLGEIESFIENSKPFVDGLDMQNGVYEAEALERLQAWEAKADSILLGEGGKQLLLEQASTKNVINLGVGLPSAQVVDYDTLIARK